MEVFHCKASHPPLTVSFFPLQYLFISFLSLPASTFLLVSITKFFPWHLSFDYIWTPVFSPKPHQVHPSPQFLCARPVSLQICCWEGDQGYKPSFGSHPCWKDFHMCKSFRTNTADSVSDLPYVQWHHRTTPCGTFPPITFQLSENEHQKHPEEEKKKKRCHKRAAWGLEKKLRSGQCLARQRAPGVLGNPHLPNSQAVFVWLFLMPRYRPYSPVVPLIHCSYFIVDLERGKAGGG